MKWLPISECEKLPDHQYDLWVTNPQYGGDRWPQMEWDGKVWLTPDCFVLQDSPQITHFLIVEGPEA